MYSTRYIEYWKDIKRLCDSHLIQILVPNPHFTLILNQKKLIRDHPRFLDPRSLKCSGGVPVHCIINYPMDKDKGPIALFHAGPC